MLQMETDKDLSAYQELCKFAEKYELILELEKPFKEMPNLFLKIIDEGMELGKVALENIDELEPVSAELLNDLSKAR